MINFEFKARLTDPQRVQQVLQRHQAAFHGTLHQVDTYWRVPHGRLKLRVTRVASSNGTTSSSAAVSQLIFYERLATASVKASDYHLVPVTEAESLRTALELALGILSEVEKTRELYLLPYQYPEAPTEARIRIHLDQVIHLGEFLELEAVVAEGVDPDHARRAAEGLLAEFGVLPTDLLPDSYGEMIISERSNRS